MIKILRYILYGIAALLGVVVLFLAFTVAPLDRSPPSEHPYYTEMLNSISPQSPVEGEGFEVGYAKENLTPSHPTGLAGYPKRRGKVYDKVHDSIYVRALVVKNGKTQIAIVTADLLLIPPEVYKRLQDALPTIGFSLDNTYLGATHTHNSIGHWSKGGASIIYGSYEDSMITFMVDKIKRCIQKASRTIQPATLAYGAIPIDKAVRNRVVKGGPVDSLMRVIQVVRKDSSKLLLMTYTAHATCLLSKDMNLSRDYPGKLVDEVEARGYAFAMFMAGSVGSHGCDAPEYGEACVDWMANEIYAALDSTKNFSPVRDSTLFMYRVPLKLGTAQAKILPNWRVRQWFFYAVFGEYPAYLSALRIGDIVLLSTPCDFSGQFDHALDSTAATLNKHVMVTSFNGAYIGYVTPLRYFDVEHHETQIMNWYGRGTGEYLVACMEKMMVAVN